MKAGEKLRKSEEYISAGQAYNISDGNPMCPYQFLKPLFDSMEQPLPWIPIPFILVYLAAYICEWLHLWLGGFDPLFTRNEIMKVTNSHYCKLDKAIEELGYEPKKYRVSPNLSVKLVFYPCFSSLTRSQF